MPASGLVGGLYALLVLAATLQIWRRLQRKETDQARSTVLRLAPLVALPCIAWLSVCDAERLAVRSGLRRCELARCLRSDVVREARVRR